MRFRSNLLALFVQPHDPKKFAMEKNSNYQQSSHKNSRQGNKSNIKDGTKVTIEIKSCGSDVDGDLMLGNHRLRNLILDLR